MRVPEHQYHVFALGATGDEKYTWELPDNIPSLDVLRARLRCDP